MPIDLEAVYAFINKKFYKNKLPIVPIKYVGLGASIQRPDLAGVDLKRALVQGARLVDAVAELFRALPH